MVLNHLLNGMILLVVLNGPKTPVFFVGQEILRALYTQPNPTQRNNVRAMETGGYAAAESLPKWPSNAEGAAQVAGWAPKPVRSN